MQKKMIAVSKAAIRNTTGKFILITKNPLKGNI